MRFHSALKYQPVVQLRSTLVGVDVSQRVQAKTILSYKNQRNLHISRLAVFLHPRAASNNPVTFHDLLDRNRNRKRPGTFEESKTHKQIRKGSIMVRNRLITWMGLAGSARDRA